MKRHRPLLQFVQQLLAQRIQLALETRDLPGINGLVPVVTEVLLMRLPPAGQLCRQSWPETWNRQNLVLIDISGCLNAVRRQHCCPSRADTGYLGAIDAK